MMQTHGLSLLRELSLAVGFQLGWGSYLWGQISIFLRWEEIPRVLRNTKPQSWWEQLMLILGVPLSDASKEWVVSGGGTGSW